VFARGRGSLPAQTDQEIASGDANHMPPTCVIADDDPAVRCVLALAIARCGLEPQGFGTAREVLEAWRRNPPISCSSTLRCKAPTRSTSFVR
jgi:hypothetical protein